MKKITSILVSIIYLCLPIASFGAMSSTNYTIYSDSIGTDGGAISTSTSYSLQDTAGQSPAGSSASSTYEVRGGYQFADHGILSMSVSNSAVSLGVLDPGTVKTATTTISVSTDSLTGYTLSLTNITGSIPFTVNGGAVTAGTNSYGVSASGQDSAVAGDVPVSEGMVIASANSQRYNSAVTLTFKASIATVAVVSSTYQQSMTATAAANF